MLAPHIHQRKLHAQIDRALEVLEVPYATHLTYATAAEQLAIVTLASLRPWMTSDLEQRHLALLSSLTWCEACRARVDYSLWIQCQ